MDLLTNTFFETWVVYVGITYYLNFTLTVILLSFTFGAILNLFGMTYLVDCFRVFIAFFGLNFVLKISSFYLEIFSLSSSFIENKLISSFISAALLSLSLLLLCIEIVLARLGSDIRGLV